MHLYATRVPAAAALPPQLVVSRVPHLTPGYSVPAALLLHRADSGGGAVRALPPVRVVRHRGPRAATVKRGQATARRVRPTGATWMKLKVAVFATYGDVCILCDHPGSRQVDHLVPVKERPDLAWDIRNLRPVHGSGGKYPNPCAECGGAFCNQIRGTRSIEVARADIARQQASLLPRRSRRRRPRRTAARAW